MPPLGPASTILVVADSSISGSDARLVVDKLRTIPRDARAQSEPAQSSPSSPHSVVPWTIRNKYYTADVQFRLVSSTQGNDSLANVSEGEEPAVVVLTRSQATPLSPLQALLGSLAARDPEFDVAILVTVPSELLSDTLPSDTAGCDVRLDTERWDDLAINNGFEWVDLGEPRATDDATDELGTGEGLARIRDALESHLWENMVRLAPTRPSETARGKRSAESDRDDFDDDAEDEDDFESLGMPPLPEPRPFVPTKLEFPSTFLPSITRKATTALSPSAPTTREPLQEASRDGPAARASSFDDDFSPFVEAAQSSSSSFQTPFEPFMPTPVDSVPLDSVFRDSSTGSHDEDVSDVDGGGGGEEELESLDHLFEQIRLARLDALSSRRRQGEPGLGRGEVVRVDGIVKASEEEEEEEDEETMLHQRRERAERLLEQVLGRVER